jgi:hypothetical protein
MSIRANIDRVKTEARRQYFIKHPGAQSVILREHKVPLREESPLQASTPEAHAAVPSRLQAPVAPTLSAHAVEQGEFARAKEHMTSLLSFVDFNHFADLRTIGIKDTNHFMTELLSDGYAAQSRERRTAVEQALVDQVIPYINGKQTIAGATRVLCESLGPGWVKFMQILAVRAEVVKDPEFRAEFRRASEENKAQPLSELNHIMVASLGENWRALFSEIDAHAFATGSVAQGHRAKTKAGEEVVVKIAKPESVAQLAIDTQLIKSITDRLAPHSRVVADATQVLAEGIADELDFPREAAVTARAHARSPEHAPKVFAALSGHHVLTTGFIAGQSLGKAQAALSAEPERAAKVATAYFHESRGKSFPEKNFTQTRARAISSSAKTTSSCSSTSAHTASSARKAPCSRLQYKRCSTRRTKRPSPMRMPSN